MTKTPRIEINTFISLANRQASKFLIKTTGWARSADFWNRFFQEVRLPKETKEHAKETILNQIVESLAEAQKMNDSTPEFYLKNFFDLPQKHPTLSKIDLERIFSGEETDWLLANK